MNDDYAERLTVALNAHTEALNANTQAMTELAFQIDVSGIGNLADAIYDADLNRIVTILEGNHFTGVGK